MASIILKSVLLSGNAKWLARESRHIEVYIGHVFCLSRSNVIVEDFRRKIRHNRLFACWTVVTTKQMLKFTINVVKCHYGDLCSGAIGAYCKAMLSIALGPARSDLCVLELEGRCFFGVISGHKMFNIKFVVKIDMHQKSIMQSFRLQQPPALNVIDSSGCSRIPY